LLSIHQQSKYTRPEFAETVPMMVWPALALVRLVIRFTVAHADKLAEGMTLSVTCVPVTPAVPE
jgi:hypothetical protein